LYKLTLERGFHGTLRTPSRSATVSFERQTRSLYPRVAHFLYFEKWNWWLTDLGSLQPSAELLLGLTSDLIVAFMIIMRLP